jgi:hypothetical protein
MSTPVLPMLLPTGLALASVLVLASGCQRDEVTHTLTPKTVEAPVMAGGMPPPPGMAGNVPTPPMPSDASSLKWTLPTGWTDTRPGGMRFATLKPAVPGKVEVSVVVLPGPAGGELPNVNRWRGQIGLPPVDEAALKTARVAVKSRAGEVSLFDFTSEDQQKSRMVAGLLSAKDSTWFIKMLGDADAVGAARPEFVHLLETLHFDD